MNQSAIPTGPRARPQPNAPGAGNAPDARAEQPGIPFWTLPLALLLVALAVTVALIAAPPDVQPYISVYSQMLSMFLCLGCTSIILARAPAGRARWAWGFIAAAQGLFAIGNVVILALVSQPNVNATVVSLADLFFLPLAPLTAIGAVLFPAATSTLAKQMRVILDVSIAVGPLLGLALVFLIAPRAASVASGASTDIIFILYPVTDLTLLLTLIVLLVRGITSSYRPVIFWLLIGMVFLLYADTAYNYLSLPNFSGGPTYTPGLFYVDPFWVATAFAFSLAALSMLPQSKQLGLSWSWLEKLTAPTTLLRPSGVLNQFLLLGLPVAVLVGLLIFTNATPDQRGTNLPLILLTALIFLLIISRQILTQRDLVDARIATERAQQLDALKDQFITSVNHELRTPLMTLYGYLELLSDEDIHTSREKQRDMLGRARQSCGNLVQLVRSILDTRRIEQDASNFEPEVVPLRPAVEAALSLIDPHEADPAGHQIIVDVTDDLVIWGDSVRMQQVLTNLLSNAIKYSPAGTPITLRAHLVAERTGRLLGNKRSGQPMVEITVQDQGLGIPIEQQDLLFRRFVRLPREIASNIHGNGLGLYLCRAYVEAMEGKIWVESTGVEHEGSVFHLRLPQPPPNEYAPALTRSAPDATPVS